MIANNPPKHQHTPLSEDGGVCRFRLAIEAQTRLPLWAIVRVIHEDELCSLGRCIVCPQQPLWSND